MILLQLHYNQMLAVFKLSQRVSHRSCNRQRAPVLIRNFTLKTMNRKLKLKVTNFARHIFPIVITFLYLTIGQFGLVVHYLKDWLCRM